MGPLLVPVDPEIDPVQLLRDGNVSLREIADREIVDLPSGPLYIELAGADEGVVLGRVGEVEECGFYYSII